jgi:ABC-type amino acid transport substrate-binding protein
MGFTMTTQLNIEWLIPSRPYYEAPYVLVVKDGRYARLGDIPAGMTVGTTQMTAVDEAMHTYQQARPEAERWVRIPFPSNAPILDYLGDGRIEGALMWEPMFARMRQAYADDAGFGLADLDPLRADPVPIGMMLREHNTFLRAQIDQVIGMLADSGRLQEVIDSVGASGQAPSF